MRRGEEEKIGVRRGEERNEKKRNIHTIGCWSRTFLSKSPCSQNSAATIRATWGERERERERERDEHLNTTYCALYMFQGGYVLRADTLL